MKKLILKVVLVWLYSVVVFSSELPKEVTVYEPAGDKCIILDAVRKILFVGEIESGKVIEVAREVSDFAVSSDKNQIVYNVRIGTTTVGQMWIYNLNTMTARKVADDSGYFPSWGKDDQYILYRPWESLDRLIAININTGERKVIILK